ncbi:MAG TPA: heme ABC exporter ATP-binding protein CcmA [Anaerolineales bacterium]|nr:heme ABC exporter ATP-binding protein CcmA [Anaerolineales bacterium]
MIAARGLGKRFGYRLVLESVNLKVNPGELVVLLGPNGAGKSTLLRILASLSRPTFGEVEVAGSRFPQQAAAARAQIGFLGHKPMLHEDLSARQNLIFYASLYGVKRPDARIKELLNLFDLDPRRHEPVRTFSRGMQQRLAVARAMLHRPKVLLLDEPHSGLDREAITILDGLLRDLAKKGTTILLATHDLQVAQRLAQRVEVLAAGRLAASWRRRQLASRQFPSLYDRALRRAQLGGQHA